MDRATCLGSAVTRMERALMAANGDEPVPSCPGWNVTDLAGHLGAVHRWAAAIVLTGARQDTTPDPFIHPDLPTWYAATAQALMSVLDAVDPTERCWTLEPEDGRAGFWSRRQLHETTVHAIDAEQAVGFDSLPIPPEVAVDGVGEVVELWLPRMQWRWNRPADLRRPVLLRSTDTGHSWLLTPRPDGPPDVGGRVDIADNVVDGRAEDLYLSLWKRRTNRVTVHGAAAAAFLAGPLTA